ncbi:MAG TPA: BTAD domain-containing putative transcriptional regulator [Marmoricola sp.]|nr:BTAD domain-containing putative transcriptional regulator [Marmoricola sp.]
MPIALTLLDGVLWRGQPVVGERSQALLAALADGHAIPAERLVEQIWADDVPANPTKALHVLVSRTRTACGPEAAVRAGEGYRLGLAPEEVDATVVRSETAAAQAALEHDPVSAATRAREVLGLAASLTVGVEDTGPLAEVRRTAGRDAELARRILAQASSRCGAHAEALPILEEVLAAQPDDESVLADLIRSLSVVRGPAAALERFEAHRSALRERLGVDPGPELRRLHQELLSLDSPVRDGLHYDATTLVGRGDDLRRLRAALVASRVVSIVGAGGLGKTRLAHVIGREAVQPVVHFVELVGVTAPEDVVGEIGAALGVRDSVSGRRTLTPAQRADVRSRIAQHLDQAPSLLILDNCEHLVEAVADLVAQLVGMTRELRVLTTTRAPLSIAAERVYPLGELGVGDAIELFVQRAVAARPDAVLDDGAIGDIVRRLDGLPLAIELAAAKVRVMSTAEIARRLEDRFALLRGGDRSAPDRHQTLLAVIDWSWNLLDQEQRRALRWLSTFHDGFTLDAAEHVLGATALDAVHDRAGQSLVAVVESRAGVRYRMLETVREFGRVQLVEAGEDDEAAAAHRAWAVQYAERHGARLWSSEQFDAVDALREEEANLADALRQALAVPDPETTVQLLAALAGYWSVLGLHTRVIVLAEAIVAAIDGWTPPPEAEQATRVALVLTLNNALIIAGRMADPIRALLRHLGPGEDPRVAAMVTVMTEFFPDEPVHFYQRLEQFAASPARHLAGIASQWQSHVLENAGDPEAAVAAAERALTLVDEEDGPWARAMLHTQAGQLEMQLGRAESGVRHARAALPVLERLGARDDELQLRSLVAMAAVLAGDLDGAEAELARMGRIEDSDQAFGGRLVVDLGRAELALARGDLEPALAVYRNAVDGVRDLEFPGMSRSGLEPWVLFGESAALAAHAYHAGPEHEAYADALFGSCLDRVGRVLDPSFDYLDFPVAGLALFATGAWGLLRDRLPVEDAVRLLVLAEAFAYNRSVPTMAWERIVPHAEAKAPGKLSALRQDLGGRRGPELLDDVRTFVSKLG